MIKENIENIQEKIAIAQQRSSFAAKEVLLLAVTKTVAPEHIREAVAAGVTVLGENRVQELLEKYDVLPHVTWHIIGHLQSNKVKYIVDKAAMIESLDNFDLASEIQKHCAARNLVMPVLVQVNVDNDENKFGIKAQDTEEFLKKLSELPNLKVQGLMTIGCLYNDPTKARQTFKSLRTLFTELQNKNMANIEMKYLSMGMSHDYQLAVEEGANIVRIGSAIFGCRA